LGRHSGQRHSARRQRLALHGADPDRRRGVHPARHQPPCGRNVMTTASLTTPATSARTRRYGSMSRDRRWALPWSYVFLTLFAIFLLSAAVYIADPVVEARRGVFGRRQSMVGAESDARQLFRAPALANVSHLLPQLGAGLGDRGDDPHADQRSRRFRAVAHA